MNRKSFLSLLLIVLSVSLLPAAEWYNTYTTQVGPGSFHRHFTAPSVPWNIEVLEVDLSNPYISIESVKADDALYGYERTSSMSVRNDWAEHSVVGAINADFYGSGGIPVNTQIIQGELLKNTNGWSTLGFDFNDVPLISRVSYSGAVTANGETKIINTVNSDRLSNYVVLYNSFMGANTGTNQWGKELLISPLSSWAVNDTVLCRIEKIEDSIGSMAIPKGKAVLSAHDAGMQFFTDNTALGDTIKVILSLEPHLDSLKALVGGFPKIIKNGQNYALQGYAEEGGSSTFAADRHPRTAAGYSADGSKLFFVVVDGRQAGLSVGMSLPELADFMIDIGAETAVNLDGGGSSTLVVRHTVKNSPSDGSERLVANSLQAVSLAPQTSLAHIQMQPDDLRLFKGDVQGFGVSGWDDYYNPVSINKDNAYLSVDESLGYINEDGKFTADKNGGDGWVYSHYEGLKDSAHIHIKAIKTITLNPRFCAADTLEPLQFAVRAVDEDGAGQTLPNNSYIWTSEDESVGTIDSTGLFRGRKIGETRVFAQYAELVDTAIVRVEVGSGEALADSMDSLLGWSVSGENIDTAATVISIADAPRTFGTAALSVDYSFVRLSTERSTLHLNTDIPVYGTPEFISFDFKSDGMKHKAYVLAADNNDELFKAQISGYAVDASKYDTLTAKAISFRAVNSGTFNYPIKIKSIWIKLGYSGDAGTVNSGTIYFDNLRVKYPEVTSIYPLINDRLPQKMELHQNYPNPFNPQTTIGFQTQKNGPVRLEVFDLLGRKVETLIARELAAGYHTMNWDASEQACGIYIYRLQHGKEAFSRKMILLK